MADAAENHEVVFMFQFVKKVNEITANQEQSSSKCIVGNLGWRILVEQKIVEDDEFEYVDPRRGFLAVKVECVGEGESKLFCSYGRVRLSLIAQKEGMDDYVRDFEYLFSALNSSWGCPEFMEWDKVIDPANGYVVDNILKLQAHVEAVIPQGSTAVTTRDLPVEHDDWLALFEGNLNDRIVGRISAEFIKMNAVIGNALRNEEVSEKIVGAAVDSLSVVVRSEIQALEKKLEKFCANHIAKVIREMKSVKENVASGSVTTDMFEGKSDQETKMSSNDAKKVQTFEEETVPVSVLKIMKELIVEQQRTSYGTWIPRVAAYYRSNELHSYQPDSGVLQPLTYENNSETLDAPRLQDVASSEMRRSNDDTHSGIGQQQKRKNEASENKGSEMSPKMAKQAAAPNEVAPDQSDEEIFFLGKTADGEVDVHKVYHPRQLLELKNKYKSFKICGSDEF